MIQGWRQEHNQDIANKCCKTCIGSQAFMLIWSSSLLTVSMSVFILGGSNKRVTDSIKTKKAMTIRNRPLMNPESISTRPYLQKNQRTHFFKNIQLNMKYLKLLWYLLWKTFHMFSISFTRKRRSWWLSSGSWGQRTGRGLKRSSQTACGSRLRSVPGCWSRRRRRAPQRWKPERHRATKLKETQDDIRGWSQDSILHTSQQANKKIRN